MQSFSELRRLALQAKKANATSRYIGITGISPSHWLARVGRVHVGTFRTEREAAEARDEAATRLLGRYLASAIQTTALPLNRLCKTHTSAKLRA